MLDSILWFEVKTEGQLRKKLSKNYVKC